jgi:hypothetical protein
VLEVNAAPGFRMHLDPTGAWASNVAEPVVDMLFPPGAPSRIPIIAVTGTNGKTTTTRLIAHIMRSHGYKVGMTCSDGVYIMNRLLMQGDCTGPVSAQFVLKDPWWTWPCWKPRAVAWCAAASASSTATWHLHQRGRRSLGLEGHPHLGGPGPA